MSSRAEQNSARIGFWLGDASLAYGGIGPYAWRILDTLVRHHEAGWTLVLLVTDPVPPEIEQLARIHPDFIELDIIPAPPTGMKRSAPRALILGGNLTTLVNDNQTSSLRAHYLHRWLTELNLDLLHFPTQTILHPDLQVSYRVTMQGVEALLPSKLPVPYLVTMHDVQELHFPSNFTPAVRAIRAVHHWKALEGARRVIVSFDHVKEDLLTYFAIASDKIDVCGIPFGSVSLREPTSEQSQSLDRKYAAWQPYLLYPSFVWLHKNHLQLVRALRQVKDAGFPALRLICTGGKDHPAYFRLIAELESLSLTDSVLFAGIVPEEELSWLYRHTSLVTIPTRYEAGSFPLYEAVTMGVPVICSRVTSLPETIGDARFTFDPDSSNELTQLITRMLSDLTFAHDNIANSRLQSDRLRSINVAARFYASYRRALVDSR